MFSYALLAFTCTVLPALAFTYTSNDVVLSLDSGKSDQMISRTGPQMDSATFYVDDFFISDGQDPERRNMRGDSHYDDHPDWVYGNVFTHDRSEVTFSWSVGRHGTSATADWWNSQFAKSETTFNDKPGSLNFAFFGSLACVMHGGPFAKGGEVIWFNHVGFAQGHDDNGNNWWFGLQNSTQYKDGSQEKIDAVEAYDSSGRYKFTFYRGRACIDKICMIEGTYTNNPNEVVMRVH